MAEKAVRSSVWACSSTTAISRFHMICSSMSLMGLLMVFSSARIATGSQHQGAAGIDGEVEAGRDVGGGAGFHDERGTCQAGAGDKMIALEHWHRQAAAEPGVEDRAVA